MNTYLCNLKKRQAENILVTHQDAALNFVSITVSYFYLVFRLTIGRWSTQYNPGKRAQKYQGL